MSTTYLRPASVEEAVAAKSANPEAAYLSGGTWLLSDRRAAGTALIDVSRLVPHGIVRRRRELVIGAGATFQDIIDSKAAPAALAQAAASMANRNIRNRATAGGNLGAGKSCASLIPILLVLDARVETQAASRQERVSQPLSAWLERPAGLLLDIIVPLETERRAAFGRWGRNACDISVLTAAASYRIDEDGSLTELAVAAGGLGPRARRFPEIERLFEGGKLPAGPEIERLVAPLLSPVDDLRGGAAFKRLRGASLIAEVLLKASPDAAVETEETP